MTTVSQLIEALQANPSTYDVVIEIDDVRYPVASAVANTLDDVVVISG